MMTFLLCILIMALIVAAGKFFALLLPFPVRLVIGIGLGIAGPIYFFVNWHWIWALIVTIPWIIVCGLFINGSDYEL